MLHVVRLDIQIFEAKSVLHVRCEVLHCYEKRIILLLKSQWLVFQNTSLAYFNVEVTFSQKHYFVQVQSGNPDRKSNVNVNIENHGFVIPFVGTAVWKDRYNFTKR